jgi:hypothetical protein
MPEILQLKQLGKIAAVAIAMEVAASSAVAEAP